MLSGFRSFVARSFQQFSALLAHRCYPLVFSFAYAVLNVFSFYPGILYSDSYPRWRLAIELADKGLAALSWHTNQHPVLPSFLLSVFYRITNEIGFYILCQVFAFAAVLFMFVHTFRRGALINIVVSAALLLPVNRVYALFHSYDSVAAILLMVLSVSLVHLYRNDARQLYILPLLFFALSAFRFNSVALLMLVALAVVLLMRRMDHPGKQIAIYVSGLWLLALAPLFVKMVLPMVPAHSWAVGVTWEYVNLAVTSRDKAHVGFLADHGVDINKAAAGACYRSTYCHAEVEPLVQKVKRDTALSKTVLRRYLALASDQPWLFMREKARFWLDLLGYYGPIANAEIAKWRQNDGEWLGRFAALGFRPSADKERFIDRYFSFVNKYEVVLLRPYVVFLIALGLVFVVALTGRRQQAMTLLIPVLLAIGYYATFFVTCGSHELRYFFPSWFLLQAVCLPVLVLALSTVLRNAVRVGPFRE